MKNVFIILITICNVFITFSQRVQKTEQGVEYYFLKDEKGENATSGDYVELEIQQFDKKGKAVLPEKVIETREVSRYKTMNLVSKGDQIVVFVCESSVMGGPEETYCYKELYSIKKVIRRSEVEAIIQAKIDSNTAAIEKELSQYSKENIRLFEEDGVYAITINKGNGEVLIEGNDVVFEIEEMKGSTVGERTKRLSCQSKYKFLCGMNVGCEVLLLGSLKHVNASYREYIYTGQIETFRTKIRVLSQENVEITEVETYEVEEAVSIEGEPMSSDDTVGAEEAYENEEIMK